MQNKRCIQIIKNKQNRMSYCQKHRNHHCVHSHKCTDQSHKKKQQRSNSSSLKSKSSASIIPSKYHPPLGTIQDNQQCQFEYTTKHTGSNLNLQAYINKISTLTQQLEGVKRNQLNLDIENRKLKQRNSHVQCQIQYLRQQLGILVDNHNTDISKSIKRNLVQNTALNIKIKELMSQLTDQQKRIQQLESQNYSMNRKNKHLQKSITGYEQKIKIFSQKNQQLCLSNSDYNSKLKKLQMDFKLLKDKYQLLVSSSDNGSKNKQKKLSQLLILKQKHQQTIKSKQSQFKNSKQLHQIEKKTLQKLIQELKETLHKKQDEAKRNKAKAKQAEENLNQLKSDYQHAKNIILKHQKMKQKQEQIHSEIQQKITLIHDDQQQLNEADKKTIPKINVPNQQNNQKNNVIIQLQKQNLQYKTYIQQLQSKLRNLSGPLSNKTNLPGSYSNSNSQNIVINQQFILSIGASTQFKKIIQQKNGIIKQLMREKSNLYNQIFQQQAYKQH